MKKIFLLFCAVLFISSKVTAERTEIVIVHVNDVHSKINNFPKFKYVLDSLRMVHKNSLLVSAGDLFSGNPIVDFYPQKGYPTIDLMNDCGFNLSVVGNHEFDYGPKILLERRKQAKFLFISSNIKCNDSFPKTSYFQFGKIKLQFVGLTNVENSGYPATHPKNIKGIEFIKPLTAATSLFYPKSDSVNALIALTHIGIEYDTTLARLFPELDIIIGGHSHTKIDSNFLYKGVLIAQADSWLKYAGIVKLIFEDGKLISKSSSLINLQNRKENKKLKSKVNKYNNNPKLNQVLTTVLTDFNSKYEIGELVTKAWKEITKTDFALQNLGGIRIEELTKGNFTVLDAYAIDPFENKLCLCELTGLEIKNIIYEVIKNGDGYPPAFFGGHLLVDNENNFNIIIDVKPIDEKKLYKIAISSYIAEVFYKGDKKPYLITAETTAEILIKYLKKQPNIKSSFAK